MKKKRVWYRAEDGWFYGQVGSGRVGRRLQRFPQAPDTPRGPKKAQKKYEALLDESVHLSADTRLKRAFLGLAHDWWTLS